MSKKLMFPILLCLISGAAFSKETLMHFQHEVKKTIPNDELRVVLSYDRQSSSYANSLVSEASAEIQKALKIFKAEKISSNLVSLSVSPVYDHKNNQILKWHLNANVELKSTDFKALNEALKKTTDKLKPSLTEFRLSEEKRDKELALIKKQTLTEFMQKARESASFLGFKNASLREITVLHQNSSGDVPVFMRSEVKALASSAEILPVESPGSSNIQFSVQGTVVLSN